MTPTLKRTGEFILGLDIGTSSIGWAMLGVAKGKPAKLIRCGSRVFDAGIDAGDFSAGKENSRNATRRQARQARRLTNRRMRRRRKLFNLLVKAGLLPAGEPAVVLPELDASLRKNHLAGLNKRSPERRHAEHVLPYRLRALALTQKLEPFELGRALYHLAQRRGYKSNRKERAILEEPETEQTEEKRKKKEADSGKEARKKELNKVEGGITELEQKMKAAGAETLGQYLATLDPEQERIRRRWTSRQMYLTEFDKIWTAQAAHYPAILTDEFRKRIHKTIFHQRPLKGQSNLIGTCEFERGRKRAPWGLFIAQRFRLLQQVNDTRIVAPDGSARFPTADERDTLLNTLDREGDLTFAKARKLLNLSRGHKFNWEAGGEKRFLGNGTNAKLAEIFGDRWWKFSDADRDKIVEDYLSIHKDDALARRGMKKWGLSPEEAEKFGHVALEDGYCALSRQALAKIVPMLQDGVPYATAVKELYGTRNTDPVDFLSPPASEYPHIRNPMVLRVLAELRKVVNAIIREHGKPAAIRVELARDMRRSKKQRTESWKQMRRNQTARKKAAARIAEEAGIQNPSRADIEKVLLFQECGEHCPYTGKSISMNALVGSHPQFDIEHIIPFSRCLNDSFMNKTLCDIQENRDHKRNRTPFEAYAPNPEKWQDILSRVRKFKGNAGAEKLRRFQQETIEDLEEFTTRQLNDTRYATRQATDYLALLYGGLYEEGGKRRIQASKGSITAYLRNQWQLNSILGDGGSKSRDDHRHHAVDAVAIALSDPGAVKMLSHAAARAEAKGTRWWREHIQDPWPQFLDDVREVIESLVVSHRISRKVNGPMHEETNYAPSIQRDAQGRPASFTVRKPLESLSTTDLKLIADETVRRLVTEKLQQLSSDPKKAFADPQNHPCFRLKDGRSIPIHAVRLRRAETAIPIGETTRKRWVHTGSNHHMEVFEVKDAKGNTRWIGRVVSRYEAMRRLATRKPVVDKTPPDGGRFIFSLAPGEIVQLTDAKSQTAHYRVRTVSQSKSGSIEIAGARLNDARLKEEMIKSGDWLRIRSVDGLAQTACRKVIVAPLGEVRYAND